MSRISKLIANLEDLHQQDLKNAAQVYGITATLTVRLQEVLKFFDKKNERLHEMAMFSRQCELEQIRGQMKLAEIGAQREAAVDVGVMDAFNAAINQQAEMVKAAGGWAASLSASVKVLYSLIIFSEETPTK